MATAKKTTKATVAKATKKPVAKKLKFDRANIIAKPAVEAIRKKFSGVVTSDKMTKTIVVKVETVNIHPKYHKRFVVSRKYKVHDEREQFGIGDSVSFVSCRPLSKDKKWRVLYA